MLKTKVTKMKHTKAKKSQKKLIIIGFVSFLGIMILSLSGILYYYTNSGRRLSINPFFPNTGTAFISGVNVDMGNLLPGSPTFTKNAYGHDLIDVARNLGITMFRISNSNYLGTNKKETVYTKAQWDTVLNKMSANGIRAIIILETDSNDSSYTSDTINNSYLQFLTDYALVSGVGNNPDVYAFDIKNEPILTENNISYLRIAAAVLKAVYPSVKITVGGWRLDTNNKDANGQEVYDWNLPNGVPYLDFVDFISGHLYNFDMKRADGTYPDPYKTTLSYFTALQKRAPGKPIILTEFGAANGDSISDQGSVGSKELQANIYDGVYHAVTDMATQGVLGAISYNFSPRNSLPDAWSILGNSGTYDYPAAYITQHYSLGRSDITYSMPLAVLSNNFALTDADSGKVLSVKKNDIVALTLHLDAGYTYGLQLQPSGILTASESLVSKHSGIYQSVFHVMANGSATVVVSKTSRCVNSNCADSANTVFQTTIASGTLTPTATPAPIIPTSKPTPTLMPTIVPTATATAVPPTPTAVPSTILR